MKMRFALIYSLILGVALMTACSDDDNDAVTPAENLLPPGTEYVKEGDNCVNVVYYICKGLDTVDNWHRLYSDCLRAIQSEYKAQMALCGYPDKTFNLEANVQNPAYVNIIRLEGQTDSVWKKDYGTEINREVRDYFDRNPGKKSGMFTVIFTPQMNVAPVVTRYTSRDGGIEECSLLLSFSPQAVSGTTAGKLMVLTGSMFFLDYNTEPMSAIYYSMMNKEKGPDYWGSATRLLKADAMWLNRNPAFCKNAAAWTEVPVVRVTRTELAYENGRVRVNCEFTSTHGITGVIVYNDPWASTDRKTDIENKDETVGDAVPYAVEQVDKVGAGYRFTLEFPWSDLPATYLVPDNSNYREAEIRFRFILENGMAVPMMNKGEINSGYRYPYKIKNYIPDFRDPVDTNI